MKIKNAKRSILILLALILTISFVFILLGFIIFPKSQNDNNLKIEVSAFNNDGSGLTDDEYNKYSSFYIRNSNQFSSFFDTMASGKTFEKKTVSLSADVDLSGVKHFGGTFKGIFNGNEKIVTGLGKTGNYGCLFSELSGEKYQEYNGNDGHYYEYYPKVSDLILKDFYIDTGGYHSSTYGALAESVSGDMQISNISVIDCKCDLKYADRGYNRVGMLIGNINYASNVQINNCEIINPIVNCEDADSWVGQLVGEVRVKSGAEDTTAIQIEDIVFNAESTWIFGGCDKTGKIACLTSVTFDSSGREQSGSFLNVNTYQCVVISDYYDKDHLGYDEYDLDITANLYLTDIWFYSPEYNSGYPRLEQSIAKSYKIYEFKSDVNGSIDFSYPEGSPLGSAEDAENHFHCWEGKYTLKLPVSIQIEEVDGSYGKAYEISGLMINAVPNAGFKLKEWKKEEDPLPRDKTATMDIYTASFELEPYTLTFTNATGVENKDNAVQPDTQSLTVYYDTEISCEVFNGVYIYTITSSPFETSSYTTTVRYTAYNTKKYRNEDYGDCSTIKGDRTITPEVEMLVYTITFEEVRGSNCKGGSWQVHYGEELKCEVLSDGVKFTANNLVSGRSPIEYNAEGEFLFSRFTIGKESYREDINISITKDVTITVIYYLEFDVTFKEIEHATLTIKTNPIKISEGDYIYATTVEENNEIIIKYSYLTTEVRYKLDKFYYVEDYCQESWDLKDIDADQTVTPVIDKDACTVTMGEIDETIGERIIVGDNYETENDGTFLVAYSSLFDNTSRVTFECSQTNDQVIYTYSFQEKINNKWKETVKVQYIIKDQLYAMQYKLHENGERDYIINGIVENKENGTLRFYKSIGETKEIKPQFGLKQYWSDIS